MGTDKYLTERAELAVRLDAGARRQLEHELRTDRVTHATFDNVCAELTSAGCKLMDVCSAGSKRNL